MEVCVFFSQARETGGEMFTIINFWINFTFVFVQSHETNGLRARIRNVRIANGYQHN